MVRVATVQMDPIFARPHENLERIGQLTAEAREGGAELAVFPECAVTGYVYRSLEEALEIAEPVPGPTSDTLIGLAERHSLYLVAGLLERDGDRCFNTAVLAGPDGIEAIYRKTHLLCLGVDRFTTPGDIPYRVHQLPFARVGILICYDLRFPEPSRALALQGAQLILLPTNWPVASTIQPEVFSRARAAENRVFVLAADRVGDERGATFLGRSQVVPPSGTPLAEASIDRTEILFADIDPGEADIKNLVVRPGEHEMDCFADRRPELYEALLPQRV